VCAAAASQQAPAPPAALYRIFLKDGGTLISYGDFARIADRVVLSMPVGGPDDNPALHLISIAERDVDWDRTNAYADAVRRRLYAQTRGEADFSALSREVADMLYRVGLVTDAPARLKLAEEARRKLVEWPDAHYGYRAGEIAQMVSFLDQTVSDLRIAAGQSAFSLSLVATTTPPSASVRLLPPPTFRERLELGLAAARRTPEAGERAALLRGVLDALGPATTDDEWAAGIRTRAATELAAEEKMDRAYANLTRRMLALSEPLARRADVRGLEGLVRSVLAADGRLNRSRPADVGALLATLDARIDQARRLRLARDGWALRASILRAYWRDLRPGLDRLLGIRAWLTDVRQLAGPAPRSVLRLGSIAELAGRDLAAIAPPAEAASAHGMLQTAATFAARAASTRREAVLSGSMDTAWQASSAAAGALLLIEQAVDELRRVTRAPTP
jgi:hypothetical protein